MWMSVDRARPVQSSASEREIRPGPHSLPVLGAHVSIAGGLEEAFARAKSIGCESIQIFSKNQRQWAAKPLAAEQVDAWHQTRKDSRVKAIIIHDSYLINLADPTKSGVRKAREAFVDEIQRAEALGVQGLVFHPGAHMGRGEKKGIKRIISSLDYCISQAEPSKVQLLVENTAGQGSTLGYRFEHLRDIAEGLSDPNRLGVCIDTCHTLAGGYDFRTREGYDATMRELDEVVGLRRVLAFHLNDSMKDLNSRVDRHQHIGKGCIGLEGFRLLVRDPRFSHLPMVLETPGEDKDYRRNLKVLRSLR